jgi:hypothetical protein
MTKRILFNILIFFSIYMLPWWLILAFLTFCIFYFNSFYEALLYAFLIDLTYGVKAVGILNFEYIFFVYILIIFILIEVLKKRLKFYPGNV